MVQSGFPKIILNNDKEPAIMELNRAAMRLAREETVTEAVPEESNEYVSQTNGFVEQAVQAVERKGRTLKFSVEVLHDVTLPSDHESLAFERRRGKSVRRARLSLQDVVTGMMLGKKKLKKSTEHVRQSSLGFDGIEKWSTGFLQSRDCRKLRGWLDRRRGTTAILFDSVSKKGCKHRRKAEKG